MESTREHEDSLLMLFNASGDEATFTLPADPDGRRWTLRLDTRDAQVTKVQGTQGTAPAQADAPEGAPGATPVAIDAGAAYTLLPHSMAAFTAPSRGIDKKGTETTPP
jgi:isoamylase